MKQTFVFSIILSLSLINSTTIAFALLVEQTPEELQEKSDVVLIGTILKASGRTFERVTDYTISVEKYLKNGLNQQTIEISSSGKKDSGIWVEDEPIFDTGDRVLLYLNKQGNSYTISPYSRVLWNEGNNEFQPPPSPPNFPLITISVIIISLVIVLIVLIIMVMKKH